MTEILKIRKLNENATIPTRAHASDSGWDLYASEDVVIEPGETVVVPTGIAIQLPANTEAQVRPRSGVTSRTKLRVNIGTIDFGYDGEIGVIIDNISTDTWSNASRLLDNTYADETRNKSRGYKIRKNDRIAQLVVQHLPQITAEEVTEFDGESERGDGGFGSSGIRDEQPAVDDHETIDCELCGEEKEVDTATWAYDKGMCEPCYAIYQGGGR